MSHDHRRHNRESALGRWVPFGLYVLNVALWCATGVAAGAWDIIYLASLPIPVLAIYIWRTR